MPSSKLKLKTTPAEREAKEWRRAERAARKAHKYGSSSTSTAHSRHHRRSASPSGRHVPSDEEDYHTPNYAAFKAELQALEEKRFRDKMFDAMDDDTRLDAIEASFNAYAPPEQPMYDFSAPSSSYVDEEEEYAEWVRRGMWKRTHAAEVEAQERAERAKTERKAKDKAARKAFEKAEKEAEERRTERRKRKEEERRREAWNTYRGLWDALQAAAAAGPSQSSPSIPTLKFIHLPWPLDPLPREPSLFTKEAVSAFLLAPYHSPDKTRKQRLREAILAYHPDRFVGRYMHLVIPGEKAMVEEGVGKVVRILNEMMEDDSKNGS